jgi:hypothetical protein
LTPWRLRREPPHDLLARRLAGLPYRGVVATVGPVTFLIAVALAAAVSAGVFAHAARHGSRHPTAWGVAAFLVAGVAVPVYFIRYWTRHGARS